MAQPSKPRQGTDAEYILNVWSQQVITYFRCIYNKMEEPDRQQFGQRMEKILWENVELLIRARLLSERKRNRKRLRIVIEDLITNVKVLKEMVSVGLSCHAFHIEFSEDENLSKEDTRVVGFKKYMIIIERLMKVEVLLGEWFNRLFPERGTDSNTGTP